VTALDGAQRDELAPVAAALLELDRERRSAGVGRGASQD
jgi:hypothetical protein